MNIDFCKNRAKLIKRIFVFFVALLTFAGISCNGSNAGYKLQGRIDGLPENAVLTFYPLSHLDQEPIGETVVKNGQFTFSGDVPEPRALLMVVKNNYGSLRFMVANGEEVNINGKVTGAQERDGKTFYNFSGVKVSGSPTTDKLNKLLSRRNALDGRFSEVRRKYAHIHKIFNTEGQNPAVIDSVTKSADYKKMQEEESLIFADAKKIFEQAVKENGDSFWGPLMMIAQVTYFTPENRTMYESLSEAAKNSYYGKQVKAELYPLGQPGDAVPAFSGKLIDGKQTSLAQLCKGKKYVLIDFWASWCKPCRKEIPNIKAIYDKHKANGFEIVSVSIDENEGQWRKAVEKEALVWPNLRDTDKSIAKKYHVSSVPTMFIVDGQGRLVAENLRGEQLAAKIDELMTK